MVLRTTCDEVNSTMARRCAALPVFCTHARWQDMIDSMIEHLYALPSIALNRRGSMEESVCVHFTAERIGSVRHFQKSSSVV